MKIPWTPILGAIVAFILAKVAGEYFGNIGAIFVITIFLLAWWGLHIYSERKLDALYQIFRDLDDESKREFLESVDPEIEKDMKKRIERGRHTS